MLTTAGPPTIADDPPTTFAELLGGVPTARVRFRPTPGAATEADLLRVIDHEDDRCGLVESVLVEKPIGCSGCEISILIAALLLNFVRPRRLGRVLGAEATLRLLPNLVRPPDVCFISRDRLPGGKRPREPVPGLAPDLAAEVLSKGNTKEEMTRKPREYLEAGTRHVWMVDPKARAVRVHTGPTARQSRLLREGDTLDGGDVLPGFAVPVAELFPAHEI